MGDLMVLGITGVAGVGKDTFFNVFKKIAGAEFNIKRFSLADKLKEECKEYCLENYKIDPTNCNRDQKEAIRDTLVNHAKRQRMVTEGRYWLSLIDKDIKEFSSKDKNNIAVITDIRYADYPKDEVYWLKEELGGKLLYIAMYSVDENNFKNFKRGKNEEELRNDPMLYNESDYLINWIQAEDSVLEEITKNHVSNFFKQYQKEIDKS